jgi:hypothetical protein
LAAQASPNVPFVSFFVLAVSLGESSHVPQNFSQANFQATHALSRQVKRLTVLTLEIARKSRAAVELFADRSTAATEQSFISVHGIAG